MPQAWILMRYLVGSGWNVGKVSTLRSRGPETYEDTCMALIVTSVLVHVQYKPDSLSVPLQRHWLLEALDLSHYLSSSKQCRTITPFSAASSDPWMS